MIRILVCGGRDFGNDDFADRAWLFRVLTSIHRRVRIAEIIHGAARGADSLAGMWAKANQVSEWRFPVDHRLDGPWPAAGHCRNERMWRESRPDLVLAFPGGRGTAHMVRTARLGKTPTYEVKR